MFYGYLLEKMYNYCNNDYNIIILVSLLFILKIETLSNNMQYLIIILFFKYLVLTITRFSNTNTINIIPIYIYYLLY